ncbi:MAG: hypothetical protein GW898_10575 [Thiomicrospira sp.]|nr:hypothetical protein [Thiomicrospira sp.]NCN66347.1 hypothetical protein [Thiomicrospira sp.]NCO14801.1 hypothetical protein [Thiomicrospira sp.]NCO82397.1 hypothetical protein [Thiomicrospira sp.]OIP95474.1 MAG: hypothetical protein AUK56_05385 [Thiomicrospira sp. CG2_30_44_34]
MIALTRGHPKSLATEMTKLIEQGYELHGVVITATKRTQKSPSGEYVATDYTQFFLEPNEVAARDASKEPL